MDNSNLRVQKLTINLLKVFIDICEKNNLTYYFTGGALIGVLRHQGFIPWDDDIDVGMPRKDYNKFIEIMHNTKYNGYGICDRFTDSNWHFAMSQFIDEKSEIEIDLAEEKRKAHIWIDVFPLDGLPTNNFLRFLRVKHIMLLRYSIQIANIERQVDSHRIRPWYEKVILKVCQLINIKKFINTDKKLEKLEKVLMKSDFDTSIYAGNMLGRYREKEVVYKKYFGKPQKAIFEGLLVNVPEMSHELQTALYGNYMELPPENQRVAHNVKIIKERDEK